MNIVVLKADNNSLSLVIHYPNNELNKNKAMFSFSVESNPLDCSKRFTIHPVAGMLISAPTRLLYKQNKVHSVVYISPLIYTAVRTGT